MLSTIKNKIIYSLIFLIIYAFIYKPASWKHHFWDMKYALVTIDTYKEGGNLYKRNKGHDASLVYPPTWAIFKYTSLSENCLIPLALFFITLFVFSCCLVVPIESPFEFLIIFLFMVSPAALLSIERGNVDIIIFSLTVLFAYLLTKNKEITTIGTFFLLLISTAFKAFPIFLIVPWFFIAKQRIKFLCLILGFQFVLICYFLFTKEIYYFLHNYPRPINESCMGLPILWHSIRVLKISNFIITISSIFLLFVTFFISYLFKRKTMALRICKQTKIYLICGISLLFGCFLLNSNYPYRLIFCIFLLPITFEILRDKSTPGILQVIFMLGILLILSVSYLSDINGLIYKNIFYQSINIAWLSLANQLCLISIFCIYISALFFIRTKPHRI
jgi:hypothetical protein